MYVQSILMSIYVAPLLPLFSEPFLKRFNEGSQGLVFLVFLFQYLNFFYKVQIRLDRQIRQIYIKRFKKSVKAKPQ